MKVHCEVQQKKYNFVSIKFTTKEEVNNQFNN